MMKDSDLFNELVRMIDRSAVIQYEEQKEESKKKRRITVEETFLNLKNMKQRYARMEEDEPPFSIRLSPRLQSIINTSDSVFSRRRTK